MTEIKNGQFLISEPFLVDDAFRRSVIMMLDYNENEGFGLIINKKMPYKISEINLGIVRDDIDLYFGGPVDTNRVFFVHKTKELKGSIPLGNGLYWNGDIDEMKAMLEIEYILPEDIRFYLGYSGWGKDQLIEELNEKSWILSDLSSDIVFNPKSDDELWKIALESLGEPYAEMIHYPINPQLN